MWTNRNISAGRIWPRGCQLEASVKSVKTRHTPNILQGTNWARPRAGVDVGSSDIRGHMAHHLGFPPKGMGRGTLRGSVLKMRGQKRRFCRGQNLLVCPGYHCLRGVSPCGLFPRCVRCWQTRGNVPSSESPRSTKMAVSGRGSQQPLLNHSEREHKCAIPIPSRVSTIISSCLPFFQRTRESSHPLPPASQGGGESQALWGDAAAGLLLHPNSIHPKHTHTQGYPTITCIHTHGCPTMKCTHIHTPHSPQLHTHTQIPHNERTLMNTPQSHAHRDITLTTRCKVVQGLVGIFGGALPAPCH